MKIWLTFRPSRRTQMKRMLLVLPLLLLLPACTKDARAKRAASLANVKMQTEAAEYKAAESWEVKKKIADHHFKTMPKFTQVVDDYMHGREPQGPTPEEVKADVKKRILEVKAEVLRDRE